MPNKKSETMKKFRAQVTIEFEAPDKETAVARAKEMYATENAKVRVQEAIVGWLTVADNATSPTS